MLNVDKYNKEKLNNIINKISNKENPKILYLSTYKKSYTRTETLLKYLKENNVNVDVRIKSGAFKYLTALKDVLFRRHDILFVAFRGFEILPFVRLFTFKPIVFDHFVSVYETLCLERKIFSPNTFIGRFLKWYDLYLSNISRIVLVDTNAHAQFFKTELKISNVDYLYVSCNKDLFQPIKIKKSDEYTVFWYGTVLPLHGLQIIEKSALEIYKIDQSIKFKIVGPVKTKLNSPNIKYVNWIDYNHLPSEICRSHLCLGGHFSNIEKSKRVIAGKTYQFVSCGIKTIVGDNKANKEVFTNSDVIFVKHNSVKNLVEKILEAKNG